MLQFCGLKKLKAYIGFLIIFSFVLQSTVPLIAISYKSKSSKKIPSQIQASTNFVADGNLNKLIRHIVEEANDNISENNLSDALKKCYRNLSQDRPVHSIEDVWQAMPEILQYAVEYHTRASRPNDPITSSSAIVGPGGCDLTEILGLLAAIKNRIGCVDDPVCCNTILGILGNACEIFGPDRSISSILLEILNEINGTQTIICTITGLEALSEQLAECCENLSELIVEEHIETRTIILDALEECCENIRNDILATQTQLAECCENIASINCDNPITQEDIAIGGVFVITEPGVYCLVENISYTIGAAITIATSNVTLKLQNHTMNGGPDTTGIHVEGVSTLQDIYILNGTVIGGATGVLLNNVEKSALENIHVLNYTSRGFEFIAGTRRILCEECDVQAGIGNTVGFNLDSTTANCGFISCKSYGNNGVDAHGFFIGGNAHYFKECTAAFNTGGSNGDGFRLFGTNHVLKGCLANNNGADGFDLLDAATSPDGNVSDDFELRQNSSNENGSFGFNDRTATFVGSLITNHLVIQNTAQNNGLANYDAATTNIVASLAGLIGVTNVFANIGD